MFKAGTFAVLAMFLIAAGPIPNLKSDNHKQSGSHQHEDATNAEQYFSTDLLPAIAIPIKLQARQLQQGADNYSDDHDGPKWTDIAIVVLTVGLVVAALLQWNAMKGQETQLRRSVIDARRAANRQARETQQSLAVAQKAADAAVAALDKPWLYLRTPLHNRTEWLAGGPPLSVVFKVTNYGKAPAVVTFIRAALFASPGIRSKVSDIPGDLSGTGIVDFPDANDLRGFLNRHAKEPSPRPETIAGRELVDGVDMNINITTAPYSVPFVVGVSNTSEAYKILGQLALKPVVGALPIQQAVNIYFIGTAVYDSPDGDHHRIDFCYEARAGTFREFLGPPYNDRRRVQD